MSKDKRKYFCDQCSEDGEDPYHFSDDGRICNDCNHSIDKLHVTPVVNHHLWRKGGLRLNG